MLALLTSTLRRLSGAMVLALLLAAPPWALLHYLDRPWPSHLPSGADISTLLTSPMTDRTLGALLVALLWLAWASFAWSVLAELAVALTGVRLPQPRALAPARGLAALLVAVITGGMLATAAQAAPGLSPPAQAAPASATEHRADHSAHAPTLGQPVQTNPAVVTPAAEPAQHQHTQAHKSHPTRTGTPLGQLTLVSAGREYTYTVQRGDSLSEIARQCLGDANRWPEIYALNRGTHFSDVGGTLRNPNLIYPGWTLHLPDDATAPHGADDHTKPPTQEHPKADPPQPTTAVSPPSTTPTTPTGPTASAATTPPAATDPAPGDSTTPTASPSRTTNPGTSAPTNAAQPSARPSQTPTADRSGPRGVALLTGSWIDLGLALAIAAAAALVWVHRRRRYTPRPPGTPSRVDDLDLAPLPPVVTQIRRGLRKPAASPTDIHLDALSSDPDDDPDYGPGGAEGWADPTPGTGEQDTYDTDEGGEEDDGAQGDGVPKPVPVVPALAHPLAAVWPPAGVGLVGPGAAAAARGFFVAGLAGGGLDDPDARTWVVMASATAATLLGAAAVTLPNTPRLTVTAGLDEALDLLDAQTLHRTRLVYQHEVDDVAALRIADPYEEPLPPILLIADTTGRHERTRVAALLAQGQRLDIHGVILGDWPDGDTIDVAADGTTRPVEGDANRHGSHPADIGRLSVIDPAEAADLITTLAESHTGRPQPPAPTGPEPATTTSDPATAAPVGTAAAGEVTPPGAPTYHHDPAAITEAGVLEQTHGPADAEPDLATPALREPAASDGRETTPSATDDDPAEPAADSVGGVETTVLPPGRVEVSVLGGAAILDADPQRAPRPKSLELLVYLAVNDGSATVDAILEDLLPDAPTSKAGHRLHTYVSDLRGVLRHNGGPGEYVTHPRLRYLLNPATVGVDLWQMRAAITEATTADATERIAALRRAVTAYRGALADGYDYLWIEPYREATRRQALDATTALIDALTDQPDEQLAILGPAIGLHPYAENLYQAAMRAHARLGHLDDVRALRRAVTAAAAELDVEPGDDTLALADHLVADLQTRNRRVPLQPGPGGAP